MKNPVHAFFTLLGRLCVAAIFLYGGSDKIANYRLISKLMDAHHVSGHLLPLVIALELGGGLALALGAFTRVMALALAVFSVAAISIFLLPPANSTMLVVVLAELGMLGGLLGCAAWGPGAWSLDHLWFRKTGQ
ncbi:MAG: DoxX family membrane protein [Gammaproteobacteria bacterium]|nr:DoxX family membrane protein [Gammaproteobacteria bacterium]MDE2346473.1 DoxX family membrane protein [Gammaproteobacteria bacterium]